MRIAPRFRRLTVGGEQLAGFGAGRCPRTRSRRSCPRRGSAGGAPPARVDGGWLQYPEGATPQAVRAYTVRRFDQDALELDLDVVLHDRSPSTTWAQHAAPADELAVVGPRHDFYASPEVDWHLVAGAVRALDWLPDAAQAWVAAQATGQEVDELEPEGDHAA